MGRSTVIVFLLIGQIAFGQDFMIRENNDVQEIPDGGTRTTIAWDVGVDSSGSSISYNLSTEEWNLADTGRYLIMYSDHIGNTNTTNNVRTNQIYILDSAGVEIDIARSASFLRKRNSAHEAINNGFGVIYVDTEDTKIRLRAYRVDNIANVLYRPLRDTDFSGMAIVKLDDSWNYGRYETTTDKLLTQTEGNHTAVEWERTLEEDSPFTLSANDSLVDIATNNVILGLSSIVIKGPGTDNARTDVFGRYDIGGDQNRVGWSYIRNNAENCDEGCLSSMFLWDNTSGDDFEVNVYLNEVGTITPTDHHIKAGSNLQLVELPASIKYVLVEATTGQHNLNGDYAFDTEVHEDAAQFTTTQPSAEIEVDSADSYLLLAGQFQTADVASFRLLPQSHIEVENVDINHIGATSYHRGTGTNCKGGNVLGGVLPNLDAGDVVELSNEIWGTSGTTLTGEAYMALVKWNSLFPPPPPSGPDMIINSVEDPAKVNGVTPAKVNGI